MLLGNHVVIVHTGHFSQDENYLPTPIHDEDLPRSSNSRLKVDVPPSTVPSKELSSPTCEPPPNAGTTSQPMEAESPSHPQAEQPRQQADTGMYIIT